MKIKFLSGPRKGQIEHAPRSQEVKLLVDAGLIEIVDDTPEPRIPDKDDVIPPKPSRGWKAGTFLYGDERKPAIIFHDGQGGKLVFDGPPAPQRRWSGEEQRYIMAASDCPAAVIAEFHTLAGNHKLAARAREQADRDALQAAREAQARRKDAECNAAVIARLSR
jgi:hypothetical protein